MEIEDDLGRTLSVVSSNRIISLVPSLTEMLFDLGLESRIVGVTKFCVRPARARRIARAIGGTKQFDFDQIRHLQPDLIIANKEENDKEGIQRLMQDYPVYVSDIYDLKDAFRTIHHIGSMTGCSTSTDRIVDSIQKNFAQVRHIYQGSVLYFIWQSPYMVAASHTFIDHILTWLGFENAAKSLDRYPELSLPAWQELRPDYVFLSSEPYPFRDKHVQDFKAIFPHAEILLVDGEMFSWYGSRLQYAAEYFMDFSPFRSNF